MPRRLHEDGFEKCGTRCSYGGCAVSAGPLDQQFIEASNIHCHFLGNSVLLLPGNMAEILLVVRVKQFAGFPTPGWLEYSQQTELLHRVTIDKSISNGLFGVLADFLDFAVTRLDR